MVRMLVVVVMLVVVMVVVMVMVVVILVVVMVMVVVVVMYSPALAPTLGCRLCELLSGAESKYVRHRLKSTSHQNMNIVYSNRYCLSEYLIGREPKD